MKKPPTTATLPKLHSYNTNNTNKKAALKIYAAFSLNINY